MSNDFSVNLMKQGVVCDARLLDRSLVGRPEFIIGWRLTLLAA